LIFKPSKHKLFFRKIFLERFIPLAILFEASPDMELI